MISPYDYIQLKAFARIEGVIFGILGIAVLACLVESMQDPSLGLLTPIGIIATPILAYYRLRHFRDNVLGGIISFRRGTAYLAFSFAYASLLITGATYVYFSFMDNGQFLMAIQEQMMMPEVQTALKEAGISKTALQQEMDILAQIRPIDISISILSNALISGFTLSIILGFICRRSVAKA